MRTKPGKPDESGRRTPVPIKGSNFSLKADSLILAVGERADLSFLPEGMKTENGLIAIDSWGRTNLSGIFAGGDAATGEGYVSPGDRFREKNGLGHRPVSAGGED